MLHNSADHLEACLRSIADVLASGWAELIAVDNASPDHSAAVVARLAPDGLLLRSHENVGFAAGCELARPHIRGRYWLLLNPDVELAAGTVRALAALLDALPAVAAVSPWLRTPDRATPEYPGHRFPSIALTLLELTRAHRLLPRRLRARTLLGPYVSHGRGPVPEPDWIPGAAMLLRGASIEHVGGLDRSFFLYGEDLEWCWRARAGGWRIAVADALAIHRESSSSRSTWGSEQLVADRIAAGIARACANHRGRVYALAYAALTALSLTLEARDPRRPGASRRAAATASRAWWRVLRPAAEPPMPDGLRPRR